MNPAEPGGLTLSANAAVFEPHWLEHLASARGACCGRNLGLQRKLTG